MTTNLEQLKAQGFTKETKMLATIERIEDVDGKLKCVLSDGKENMNAVLTSQVAREHRVALKEKSTVVVTQGTLNSDGDKHVLIVSGIEMRSEDKGEGQVSDAPVMAAAAATHAAVTPAKDVKTPALDAKKPAVLTRTPVSNVQPISTLNPYIHGWSIKAKVISKGPKRSFNRSGMASSVFTAELVDKEGTAIEGTFWRDAADRCYDLLEEGRVYTFGRGNVKPANKNYSRTRNDYCLHFDAASVVEPCEDDDIDPSSMTTRMEFVKIEQLPAFVDKKTPVDIIGVVTGVGAFGSVKRKSDSTELQRRDLTMVDDGLKTITVTLWGEKATNEAQQLSELVEMGTHPIVALSACRVSSYNGVSVSTTMRSTVMIDPSHVEQYNDLKVWYDTTGCNATTSAIGEGLTTAKKSKRREYLDIAKVLDDAPVSPDSKPLYATVNAMVASINPDQSMYYLACPENNRKVVEQGPGEYFCEYDGKTYPCAVRRYIASARIMDSSGIALVQVFNEQAEILFGKSADRLHEVRDSSPGSYKAALNNAMWTEWTMRLKCQAQEYNGETRQRYAILDLKPVDFAAETRRVLDLIAAN